MNADRCRKLVHRTAIETGRDPVEAMHEFIDVIRQMNAARHESEQLYAEVQELGLMYGHYRSGTSYDPGQLLDEKELNRRYSQAKSRLRAVNKTLNIRSCQATALVGGSIRFIHGRPVDGEPDDKPETGPLDDGSELVVLYDPDDGEPTILRMFS